MNARIAGGLSVLFAAGCVYQTFEVWRLEEELAVAKRGGSGRMEVVAEVPRVAEETRVSAPALSAGDRPVVGANEERAKPVAEVAKVKRSAEVESGGESAFIGSIMTMAKRAAELDREFRKVPGREIPELELLSEADWLRVAGEVGALDTSEQVESALSKLRATAKKRLVDEVSGVLHGMGGQAFQALQARDLRSLANVAVRDANGQAPLSNVSDAVLERYEIVPRGVASAEWSKATQFSNEPVPDLFIRERGSTGAEGQVVIGAYVKDGMFRKTLTTMQAPIPR